MTEPTRDLVDRTELRGRLDAWRRGWTRDEVLAEMDAHPGAVCEWLPPSTGKWAEAPRSYVEVWRDPEVRRYDVRVVLPEPPATVWVPLTKLVGRTLPGETEPVCRYEGYSEGVLWFPTESAARAKDITVFDESGRVEVLAEGDA